VKEIGEDGKPEGDKRWWELKLKKRRNCFID